MIGMLTRAILRNLDNLSYLYVFRTLNVVAG